MTSRYKNNAKSKKKLKREEASEDNQMLPLAFSVPDAPQGTERPLATDKEERFFTSSRTPASQVKSQITIKTFQGWSGVMLRQRPLGISYLDLFCGKGVYADGTPSTPLELFDKVAQDSALQATLHMVFNDRKKRFVYELREHLMAHSGFERMIHKPRFLHGAVSEDLISGLRVGVPPIPTFAFLDPFGYVGVNQDVIRMILQNYGCDVLFFFSYHATKRVLSNPSLALRSHVEALLGAARVRDLRERFHDVDDERENERAMLQALNDSMCEIDSRSVLSFAFRRKSGYASHHLAFVSKHLRGFQKAKEAMKGASSWYYDGGIPGLEFIAPGYENRFNLHREAPSIEKLVELLIQRNRGQLRTLTQAYDSVTLDTPYVESNVREALVRLVRKHGASLMSNGTPGKLRGSLLPAHSAIVIPKSYRRPHGS
jgi:three-Cys-motif partner protein